MTSLFFHPDTRHCRPRIAISACLCGQALRYDGGSKTYALLPQLAAATELLPICPEVEAGLGLPRPPVHLVQGDNAIRARGRDNPALDVSEALNQFAANSQQRLAAMDLCGYLFKSRSPSCGLGSTPLFDRNGQEIGRTDGIQAARIRQTMPQLVLSEEQDLLEAAALERFILLCRIRHELNQATKSPNGSACRRHYRDILRGQTPSTPSLTGDPLLARWLSA